MFPIWGVSDVKTSWSNQKEYFKRRRDVGQLHQGHLFACNNFREYNFRVTSAWLPLILQDQWKGYHISARAIPSLAFFDQYNINSNHNLDFHQEQQFIRLASSRKVSSQTHYKKIKTNSSMDMTKIYRKRRHCVPRHFKNMDYNQRSHN